MLLKLVDWAIRNRSGVLDRLAASSAPVFVDGFGCDAIAPEAHFVYLPQAVVQKSVREGVEFPIDPWLVVSPLPRLSSVGRGVAI